MTLTYFLSRIDAFYFAGVCPIADEKKELTRFYGQLIFKDPKALMPDRLEMIHEVIGVGNILEVTSRAITRHTKNINRALGEELPLTFPELKSPGPSPATKSEGIIAQYYFNKGLELGAIQGALSDTLRIEAAKHTKTRKTGSANRSNWLRDFTKIQKIIERVIKEDKPNKAKIIRVAIEAKIANGRTPPSLSSIERWIENVINNGDISCPIPAADTPQKRSRGNNKKG